MKRKRFLALVLGVMMCFTLLQGNITFAASGVTYVNASGVAQTPIENATDITSSTTTWTSGWYYISSDVTISSRVTVRGTVNLILGDGATLKASDGIAVVSGDSLTIWGQTNGTGRLEATSVYNRRAGIGGNGMDETQAAGTITINGGVIYASSTEYGAAIGGGGNKDYTNRYGGSGGTITINGGNVTAVAGDSGAGIGGGWNQGNGGTIKITGGTVTATGGDTAAGIGGGGESRVSNVSGGNAGTIIIEGGNVTATGGGNAAGIGSGRDASGGSIKITGGVVTTNRLGGESDSNATVANIEVFGCPIIVCGGYKHNQSSWKGGILFTDTGTWATGTVFGNPALDRELVNTPPLNGERNLKVPNGSTFTISEDAVLDMGGSGYIIIEGTVVIDGTLKIGSARIENEGELVNNGTARLFSGWDGETSYNKGTITNNGTLYSNLNLNNDGTITNGENGLVQSNRQLTGTGTIVNGVKFDLKYITTTTATTLTLNNTDFTATLTANDNYILPETITVKVGGQEFTAHGYTRENPTILIPAADIKGSIEIIAEVATEIILTETDVYAQFADTENATLIVASYADKALKDLKAIPITTGAYEKTLADIGLDTEGADSVKAFLWTDMTTLTPLCEAKEVTLSE